MLTQGVDMAQASNAAGISQDPKLGEGEGLIGVLSRGRVRRLEIEIVGRYTIRTLHGSATLGRSQPIYLSLSIYHRLEYTVGAITNALFFAENEGWYD